jgi:hypothetical protein
METTISTRTNATFTYKIYMDSYPYPALVIYERWGKKTVRNDIQWVIGRIANEEQTDLSDFIIITRDSEEVFDGYDICTGEFVIFNELTEEGAINSFVELRNREKVLSKEVH